MLRILPVLLGLGLAVLWVIGMSVDATVWMTWADGGAATLAFATVGTIPDRSSSGWAAFCLLMIAGGLFGVWAVGVAHVGTPWLTWWTFVAACLTAITAFGAALQGPIDALRTRPGI